MTFRDFQAECANFEHSSEYYEMCKLGSEIALMSQYIENQQFMEDNYEEIDYGDVEYTEGYFQEAVDPETLEVLTEKVKDKLKEWGGKIKTMFQNLIAKFVKFLMKFTGRKWFEEDKINDLIQRKDEEISQLGKQVDQLEKKYGCAIKSAKINANKAKDLRMKLNELKKKGGPTVVPTGDTILLDLEESYKILEMIEHAVSTGSKAEAKKAYAYLKTAVNNAREHGVTLIFDNDKLEELIRRFNDLRTKYAEEPKAEEKKPEEPSTSLAIVDPTDFNQMSVMMQKALANDMEALNMLKALVNDIDAYRAAAIASVNGKSAEANIRGTNEPLDFKNKSQNESHHESVDGDEEGEEFSEASKYKEYKKAHDGGEMFNKPKAGTEVSTHMGGNWSKNELNTALLSRKEFRELQKASKDSVNEWYKKYKELYKQVLEKEGKEKAGKPLSRSQFAGIMINQYQSRGHIQ